MGVYKYKHDWCGMEQQLYLENETKENVTMPCYRCGRMVSARQIRDKSAKVGRGPDGTVGILRNENKDRRRS